MNQLDAKWGEFLRKRRAGLNYSEFAERLGISESTLFRYENSQQSITLRKMEDILRRMGVSMEEVFGKERLGRKFTRREGHS